jgi:Holliday junction resolvase RusA-like endonuclease
MINLYIRGTPRPQPRPRFVNGRVISTANKHAKLWRQMIAAECNGWKIMGGKPMSGPLYVGMIFQMPTKDCDRWEMPHTARPDADNLAKGVLDQMERNGLFSNDSRVAHLDVSKVWGRDGCVVIRIAPFADRFRAPPLVLREPDDDLGAAPLDAIEEAAL